MLNSAESQSATSCPSQEETVGKRLERLIAHCHYMRQNFDNLISSLAIIEDSIPDKDNAGIALCGLIQLIRNHQNDEYLDFVEEIQRAEGKAA